MALDDMQLRKIRYDLYILGETYAKAFKLDNDLCQLLHELGINPRELDATSGMYSDIEALAFLRNNEGKLGDNVDEIMSYIGRKGK